MNVHKAPSLIRPAKVGIIAPASAPRADHRYDEGLNGLRSVGLEPVFKRSSIAHDGYLAGTDEERLNELNSFLADADVDTLICVRGGYGVLRILDQVDYDMARQHPKLLVGYSDITALQLALFAHAGWVSISGPMVAVEWHDPKGLACSDFLALAGSDLPTGPLDPDSPLTTFVPGSAEGVLLGGNLSLITRLIGTPHLPDLSGAILFLEEVGESPYRVDGLLAHLQLAGILDSLAGVVLGGFTESDAEPDKPSLTMEQVFDDYFGDLGIPVCSGLRYGHFHEKIAVPIGVKCRLEAGAETGTIMLLESPTA
ncbi:MAG: LD-carboxypeptidase [Bacteroidetes bacterium]|nr:LD-carboxypeptidase [Bacteroidota bacterium]MDA1333324.1 LD-carboxypeptidase [Bacteroidota bacterium]